MLLVMANNTPPWCVNTNLHNGRAEAPNHLRCCPLRTGEGTRQHRRGAVWERVAKFAGLLLPQDPLLIPHCLWEGCQKYSECWRRGRQGLPKEGPLGAPPPPPPGPASPPRPDQGPTSQDKNVKIPVLTLGAVFEI